MNDRVNNDTLDELKLEARMGGTGSLQAREVRLLTPIPRSVHGGWIWLDVDRRGNVGRELAALAVHFEDVGREMREADAPGSGGVGVGMGEVADVRVVEVRGDAVL